MPAGWHGCHVIAGSVNIIMLNTGGMEFVSIWFSTRASRSLSNNNPQKIKSVQTQAFQVALATDTSNNNNNLQARPKGTCAKMTTDVS